MASIIVKTHQMCLHLAARTSNSISSLSNLSNSSLSPSNINRPNRPNIPTNKLTLNRK